LSITQSLIEKILTGQILPNELNSSELLEFCQYANKKYRAGNPIISDADYDFLFVKELKLRNPNHFFLQNIESDHNSFSEEKVLLPKPMLSIDKAYSFEEILKWIDRIFKACQEINFETKNLNFIATAKLDGFAGYDDGKKLYTRGDGKKGSDI